VEITVEEYSRVSGANKRQKSAKSGDGRSDCQAIQSRSRRPRFPTASGPQPVCQRRVAAVPATLRRLSPADRTTAASNFDHITGTASFEGRSPRGGGGSDWTPPAPFGSGRSGGGWGCPRLSSLLFFLRQLGAGKGPLSPTR